MNCYPSDILIEQDSLEEMACMICQGIMIDPVMDSCGHAFGKTCLEKLVLEGKSCPISNQPLMSDRSSLSCAPLKNYIMRQGVKCINFDKCEWKGRLADITVHIDSECQYSQVKCSNDNCQLSVQKIEIDEHFINCNFRLLKCESCQEEFTFNQTELHAEACSFRKLPCPNDCNQMIPQFEIPNHIQYECSKNPTNCVASSIGCIFKGSNLQIMDHLSFRNETFNHMRMVVNALNESQLEHETFKLEMKEKLGRIQNSIDEVSEDLNNLKFEVRTLSNKMEDHEIKIESVFLKQNDLSVDSKSRNSNPSEIKPTQIASIELEKIGSLIERSMHICLNPEVRRLKEMINDITAMSNSELVKIREQMDFLNSNEFDLSSRLSSVTFRSPKEIIGFEAGIIARTKSRLLPYKPFTFVILNKKSAHMALGISSSFKTANNKNSISPEAEKQGCYFFFANGSQRINGQSLININEKLTIHFDSGDVVAFILNPNSRTLICKNRTNSSETEISLRPDDNITEMYPFVHLWEKNEAVKIIS
jgi:hypothetical protein